MCHVWIRLLPYRLSPACCRLPWAVMPAFCQFWQRNTDATMLCRQPFDFVHVRVRARERARVRVRDTSEAVFTSILPDNTGRQSRISADIGRGWHHVVPSAVSAAGKHMLPATSTLVRGKRWRPPEAGETDFLPTLAEKDGRRHVVPTCTYCRRSQLLSTRERCRPPRAGVHPHTNAILLGNVKMLCYLLTAARNSNTVEYDHFNTVCG